MKRVTQFNNVELLFDLKWTFKTQFSIEMPFLGLIKAVKNLNRDKT